jgi:DNA-binding SARP family transcriptional activator
MSAGRTFPAMEFTVLGPVRMRSAGRDHALGGTKPRTVLATLALADGQVVGDERLGHMLWDSRPPVTATAQLHTYASRLRGVIGSGASLERIGHGYRLVVDEWRLRCDHRRFTALAAHGHQLLRAGDAALAAAELRSALSLWQGEALADVTDGLVRAERPWLEEARLGTLENRIEAELMLGMHRQLVTELTALVARHPLRERLRSLLMTALHRSEQRAEALFHFHAGRKLLAEGLGVEPGPLLARTFQEVLAGAPGAPGELAA